MLHKNKIYRIVAQAGLVLMLGAAPVSQAQEQGAAPTQGTIKVGIMHSLTGTMAISETPLKDVMLMLIDEQNKKGGLLGKKLVPVVVDPASSNNKFVENSRKLLLQDQVSAVFGCWTSASRKAVLPVFEEFNGLLFYPVQYEGEESSRNVIYTGASPVQQAIPAVDYLIDKLGVQCMVLSGTDYVFPRTINKILKNYLINEKKWNEKDIKIYYTPFSYEDWHPILDEIKDFVCKGKKAAIVSSLNGDTNVYFYNALQDHRMCDHELPVMDFSVGEDEMAAMNTGYLEGHMSTWNYFMSIDHPDNKSFIERFRAYVKDNTRVVSDPMEAHYIGFNLWVKAVEKAQSTDVNKVLDAIIGQEVPNLTGSMARVLPNHHITKPVYIGEYGKDKQYKIVWQSQGVVDGEAWSAYLPESQNLIGDWKDLKCGKYDTKQKKCLDNK